MLQCYHTIASSSERKKESEGEKEGESLSMSSKEGEEKEGEGERGGDDSVRAYIILFCNMFRLAAETKTKDHYLPGGRTHLHSPFLSLDLSLLALSLSLLLSWSFTEAFEIIPKQCSAIFLLNNPKLTHSHTHLSSFPHSSQLSSAPTQGIWNLNQSCSRSHNINTHPRRSKGWWRWRLLSVRTHLSILGSYPLHRGTLQSLVRKYCDTLCFAFVFAFLCYFKNVLYKLVLIVIFIHLSLLLQGRCTPSFLALIPPFPLPIALPHETLQQKEEAEGEEGGGEEEGEGEQVKGKRASLDRRMVEMLRRDGTETRQGTRQRTQRWVQWVEKEGERERFLVRKRMWRGRCHDSHLHRLLQLRRCVSFLWDKMVCWVVSLLFLFIFIYLGLKFYCRRRRRRRRTPRLRAVVEYQYTFQ